MMDVDSSDPRSADDRQPRSTAVATTTHLQHVLIKWTGSKRRQARQIVAKFPRKIATYYEPFLGGGSVLYELLAGDVEVGRYEVSDICQPLIALWKLIQNDPTGLIEGYAENWRALQVHGASHYHKVRREFNETQTPHLFFFLLRTCRNGLVRFNREGRFNSAFHGNRPGMNPKTVKTLVDGWHHLLASKNVRFNVKDYREITAEEGDIVYADPPYKTSGEYYFGMIDFGEFFGWLRRQKGCYLLSLNGFQGGRDRTVAVPTDLYDDHHVINNGISQFERLNGDDAPPIQDSLYIRRRRLSSVATYQLSRNRSKSAQIRNMLEDDPDLSVPEVVQRLGQMGIDVDANLVRVVRHQSQKANPWESRWCEAVSRLVERRLDTMSVDVPERDNVRVTLDELILLAKMVGDGISEDHLFYFARALWVARYARRTGKSTDTVEAEMSRAVVQI